MLVYRPERSFCSTLISKSWPLFLKSLGCWSSTFSCPMPRPVTASQPPSHRAQPSQEPGRHPNRCSRCAAVLSAVSARPSAPLPSCRASRSLKTTVCPLVAMAAACVWLQGGGSPISVFSKRKREEEGCRGGEGEGGAQAFKLGCVILNKS